MPKENLKKTFDHGQFKSEIISLMIFYPITFMLLFLAYAHIHMAMWVSFKKIKKESSKMKRSKIPSFKL
jgi:hypothetical protein